MERQALKQKPTDILIRLSDIPRGIGGHYHDTISSAIAEIVSLREQVSRLTEQQEADENNRRFRKTDGE
jgi:hypothetical protein